jgi:asparagine synthase (glutamine-hydrolysing)
MFAFALWDSGERTRHLLRDRDGEKLLYVCQFGGNLCLEPESRALSAVPNFGGHVSVAAMATYLRNGYVPESLSVYEGVLQLPSGTMLSVPALRDASLKLNQRLWSHQPGLLPKDLAPRAYWCRHSAVNQCHSSRVWDPIEADVELQNLVRKSLRVQMHCDVPIGAFLAGVIDSSLVAAIVQTEATTPIQAFTVAFENVEYDESEYARTVAKHIGSVHERIVLTGRDVAACVPQAVQMMDDPTANDSLYPVYLISRFAPRYVKAVLSGDGGDELFVGYTRYCLTTHAWNRLRLVPRAVRRALRYIIKAPNCRFVDQWGRCLGALFPVSNQVSLTESSYKLSRLLIANSLSERCSIVTSYSPEATRLDQPVQLHRRPRPADAGDRLASMLLCDQRGYLPGDSLAKIDRASMALSLETRLPLLDHRIIEFSGRLSDDLKLLDGISKFLPRTFLEKCVPRCMRDRRKIGSSLPIDRWLSGPSRDWAHDVLTAAEFRSEVRLLHDKVVLSGRGYQGGKRPAEYQMWSLVMLAAWIAGRRKGPVNGSAAPGVA